MLTLALSPVTEPRRGIKPLGAATVGRVDLPLARVAVGRPPFDPAGDGRGLCLVQVEAFSCNFRDRAISITSHEQLAQGRGRVAFLGSEFFGRVVEVGDDVTGVRVGDRVIPDATYPVRSVPGAAPGIVTNHASRGWLVLHPDQVVAVPDTMGPREGAAFSLGAQTACSMVRRTAVGPGDRALVLSGRSNTSLFIARRLLAAGVDVHVASRGPWDAEAAGVLAGATFIDTLTDPWPDLARSFDAVFDPFFDLHLGRAVDTLDFGGRYITCGLQGQHRAFAEEATPPGLGEVLTTAIVRNLSLMGNCIGQRRDLLDALDLHEQGVFDPVIDSTWDLGDGVGFVERSFADSGRLGKVVMTYAG